MSQAEVRVEPRRRELPGVWTYRALGPGDRVALTDGRDLDVDEIFAGMFELPADRDAPMPSLIPAGDGPTARCKLCGASAAGPCARCRSLVCGDCCQLTEGGATTFAVCLACVRKGGASLAPAWRGLLAWLALIALGLAAVAAALIMLRR